MSASGAAIPAGRVLRGLATPAVCVAVCLLVGTAAARPTSTVPAGGPGSTIRMEEGLLNPVQPAHPRSLRDVAPQLAGLAPWISAVGAAVAAGDFDGDGLDDEACLVDPRDDSVRIFAVPGSGSTMPTTTVVAPVATTTPTAPMGCVPADVDEDGRLDAIVYYWGRSPVIFLARPGGGFAPRELVSPAQVWNTTTLNVADVDGDGHLDVLVGNYFPDGARILDPAAVPDPRIQMQDSMSRARNAGTNRVYLNRGVPSPGRVDLVDDSSAFPADSAQSWTLSFGAQDLTGDGLPELYVANDFGPDQLLVNTSTPGRTRFTEVVQRRDATAAKSSVLGRDSFKGMGVAFPTLAGDASPSIMVSNITAAYALQESNFFFRPTGDPAATAGALISGTVPYAQDSEPLGVSRSGWSWDLKAVDLDGDGSEEIAQATGFVAGTTRRWPELQELAMANDTLLHVPGSWLRIRPGDDISGHDPNRLWCFQPDVRRFADCAATAGFADMSPTRAFAVTDVDGDGRPDLLEADQWAPSHTYLNRTPLADRAFVWVRPVLRGPRGATRAAIGAEVDLLGQQPQQRQLYPANGHTGVSAPSLVFGVPATSTSVVARVSWRDGDGVRHTATTTLHQGANTVLLDQDKAVAS